MATEYPPNWWQMLEAIQAQPERINGAEMLLVQNLRYWRGKPNSETAERVRTIFENLEGGSNVTA